MRVGGLLNYAWSDYFSVSSGSPAHLSAVRQGALTRHVLNYMPT